MSTFSQLIPENSLWNVLDSSKLKEYSTCPRKYFFRHILGWKPAEGADIHLVFGTAVHQAMEILALDGYGIPSLTKGFETFLAHYRQYFPPEADEGNKPKTPANFMRALAQYALRYASDRHEVLHIEVAGAVHVDENQLLHFKMDTICRGEQGYFSLEHKTSSRYSAMWEADWRQNIQIGTYNHVLHCLYPPSEIYGIVINGIFLHDEPKITKEGRPYAGSRDNEFHRVPVRLGPEQMEGWRLDVIDLIEDIQEDMAQLETSSEEDLSLRAFSRNRESCTRYGICPYLNVCSTTENPVRLASAPPAAFETDFWDPRNAPSVRERMAL